MIGQLFKIVRHPAWLSCMPWFACLVALLVQFRFMVFSGFQQMHGGLGDARLVNFTLEHGYRWFRQIAPHQDFWQPPIFYPYPNASAFTDAMLGFAPLYWLPRFLGAAPDTALQWWMLIVYGLNFAAAYGLLRKGVKLGVPASSAGALLMAIISVAWSSHIQLFPFFYVMLALLALFRIFDESEGAPGTAARRVWIAVFCACAVLQVWGAVYAFLFFGLLAGIALVVALALSKTRPFFVQRLRSDAGVWILALALSAAAMAPLVMRYQMTAEELGYRHYSKKTIARPYSWIVMGPQDPLLGWLVKKGGPLSSARGRTNGIGLLTFCVAAAGLFASRRRGSVQVIGIATLLMMLLSTMYWGFSPWRWIHEFVPGAGGIRAQWRVTMCLIPAAVIGMALACDGALRRRYWWLALLLVSICVTERSYTRHTVDKQLVRAHVAAIAEQVDPKYKAFYLVGKGLHASWVDDDAAWVSLATGVPTINGRYGNFPSGYATRKLDRFAEDDVEARRKLEVALEEWLDLWDIDRSEVQWIEYESLTRASTRSHRR